MYKGRFAPSPTGPLHFGSLIAALASYLDARCHSGVWQVRLDDIDPPRHDPSSFETIPNCLEQHGLYWDNGVITQSSRREAHESYIQNLLAKGRIFVCQCTRATLGSLGQCESDCKGRQYKEGSLRFTLTSETMSGFDDLVLGRQAPTDVPEKAPI